MGIRENTDPQNIYKHIRVTPFESALGAEIDAGDLRTISADQYSEIRQAWLRHLVVRFRGQQFTDEEYTAFGRRFGEFQISNPLPSPAAREDLTISGHKKTAEQAPRDQRFPQITIVSNVVENGVAIGGLGDGELVWHSDMSSFNIPPSATMLYAVEVPAGQGRTAYLNLHAAYDTLPAPLRRRVDGLQLKHDSILDAGGYWRAGAQPITDVRTSPGRIHPLVSTHPETGRNALFLGRRPYSYIPGLTVEDSEALLNDLWLHATQEQFVWRQEWKTGDVLIWDNRSVLHHREAFDPQVRRHLRRLVIQGSEPQFVKDSARAA